MYSTLKKRLERIRSEGQPGLLAGGQIGIEKESLRVNAQGTIAQTPHPVALGAALTHPWITTDYSEALLELITPPFTTSGESLAFLEDIHQFVYENLDDEILWATSMPCLVKGDESIPIANYGSSNIGFMKHVYRRGLGHRYGRPMQAISGIHFNYSVPEAFWAWVQKTEGLQGEPRELIDQAYMGMTRNIIRYGWLILYLFGSSPALCKSFFGSEEGGLDEFDESTWYLPWATSLRMSDIGYQNKNQAGLDVSYNSIAEYVASLTRAIETPYPDYQAIGLKSDDGEWLQLNANILQIENEFYSIVRPKQIAQSSEKPTLALKRRGVRYIELRALDVDPFCPTGITPQRGLFLEVFMLFCMLQESPTMDIQEWRRCGDNQALTATRGREPGLELCRGDKAVTLQTWALEACEQMKGICELLDSGGGDGAYADALAVQHRVVEDASLSPSARVLEEMRREQQGFYHFALAKSKQHQNYYRRRELRPETREEFRQAAEKALSDQADIEAADQVSFDDYLEQYLQQ